MDSQNQSQWIMRKTHPNLYLGIMGFGAWGVLTGISSYFTDPIVPFGMPAWFFATLYLIFGIGKLIGANTKYLVLARLAMLGCIVYSLFNGLAFAVMYFNGELQSFNIAINYLFIGVIQLAPLQEPAINPLTLKGSGANGRDI